MSPLATINRILSFPLYKYLSRRYTEVYVGPDACAVLYMYEPAMSYPFNGVEYLFLTRAPKCKMGR